MPRTNRGVKEKLAASLTDAFAEATPFGRDIFGIRFFECDPGTTAVGGKLQALGDAGTDSSRPGIKKSPPV